MYGEKYPDAFVKAVKKEFPDDKGFHKLLESGDGMSLITQVLDQWRKLNLSPQEIIDAIENGSIDKIKLAAERALRVDALYERYCRIVSSQAQAFSLRTSSLANGK